MTRARDFDKVMRCLLKHYIWFRCFPPNWQRSYVIFRSYFTNAFSFLVPQNWPSTAYYTLPTVPQVLYSLKRQIPMCCDIFEWCNVQCAIASQRKDG